MSLDSKVAIVTGASHPRGMGAAVATKLASLGAAVALVDLDGTAHALAERAAGIVASGGRALAVHADATDGDSVEACVVAVTEQLGPPEILVNNAGVGIGSHRLLENSEEIWSQTLAVNLMGVNRFSCAVIPHMQAAGGGVIVNNSSMSGLGAIAGIPAPYTASKHAVIRLTRAIAVEFGPDNIRCVAICPGSVKTQLHARVMEMHMDTHGLSYDEAEAFEVSTIPLGYSCEPEEVAGVVAFLVGPEGRYLTGVSIPVAGGMAPGL